MLFGLVRQFEFLLIENSTIVPMFKSLLMIVFRMNHGALAHLRRILLRNVSSRLR